MKHDRKMQKATDPVVVFDSEGNLVDLVTNQDFKLFLPVRVISVTQYICPCSALM